MVYPEKIRTKYVCRGRHVDMPRIHYVQSFRNGPAVSYAHPDDTILLHYRKTGESSNTTVVEMRGQTHREAMEIRVATAWKEITSPTLNRKNFF